MEYPPAPARPTRPGIVTAAGILLYATAALQLLSLYPVFVFWDSMGYAIRHTAVDAATRDGAGPTVVVFDVVMAVLFLLAAAVLVVLGILNGKGRNGSRITTWVFGGLLICCGGLLTLISGANTLVQRAGVSGASGTARNDEVARIALEHLPGWVNPSTLALSLLTTLLVIGALILLALPAANAYFRKAPPEQGWEPPVPPPAYYG